MVNPLTTAWRNIMSRKRTTSDKESTEPATPAESGATVAERPAAETQAEGQSFAGKVGQKKYVPGPDPFPVARDSLANVRLFYSDEDRQVAIKFGEGLPEDKPSDAVLDKMREAGFRWNNTHRIWAHPFRESAVTARIKGEQVYQ